MIKIKKDFSTGVLVFYRGKKKIKYLLIKHSKGHWGFPKGHRNKSETKLQAAVRELREETGLKDIELLSRKIMLSDIYKFVNGSGIKIVKTVDYYIGESKTKKVKIDNNEIVNYIWLSAEKSLIILTFPEQKKTLIKANKIILKNTK